MKTKQINIKTKTARLILLFSILHLSLYLLFPPAIIHAKSCSLNQDSEMQSCCKQHSQSCSKSAETNNIYDGSLKITKECNCIKESIDKNLSFIGTSKIDNLAKINTISFIETEITNNYSIISQRSLFTHVYSPPYIYILVESFLI